MNFRQLTATGKQGVDWMDPVAYAKQNGAVGIIYLATPATVNSWDRTRRARETGGGYFVEKLRNSSPDGFPSITLSQKQSENLFNGESATFDAVVKAYGADQPLPSVAFTERPQPSMSQPTLIVLALKTSSRSGKAATRS